MDTTEKQLFEDALRVAPHEILIYAARYFVTERDRSTIPDWVVALSNVEPSRFRESLDVIRRLKDAEEA